MKELSCYEQREKALKVFPECLHEAIEDEDNCFDDIAEKIKELWIEDDCFVIVKTRGSAEWAFKWAGYIGQHGGECFEIIKARGEDRWAFCWADYIGTHIDECKNIIKGSEYEGKL